MWLFLIFVISYISDSLAVTAATVATVATEDIKYHNRPHIIVLMADDLGYNDVSYRGSSQILTPNIDALGYQGVILNRHYTPEVCSPSRAALLTGKYPVNTGMQHFAIGDCEPYGLPVGLKILPQYLKQAGYSTHLVGKWHLGFARKAFIPTRRGFDSFFGFYTGVLDYLNHTSKDMDITGYDFRRNEDVTYEGLGQYSTYLFANESSRIIREHNTTKPLFLLTTFNAPHASLTSGLQETDAPQDELDKLNYITDPKMRTYAAMVTALDKSIGKIIQELSVKKMLTNSVILFYSDNGAPTRGIFETTGSNFPLRGQKYSPWEGGIRVAAAFWSPLMEVRHGVSNQLIHNTDWLPTFVAMTGNRPVGKFDGFDIWPTLMKNIPSPRKLIINDINPIAGFTSVYYKGWKYVNGSTFDGAHDSWLSTRSKYRNPNASRYLDIVRLSDTWKALSPFALRTLDDNSIRKIRRNTRTVCQPKIPYAVGCNPLRGPCLFNIKEDPCELNNLAQVYHLKTYLMQILVKKLKAKMVYPINLPIDPEGCDPRKYNGTYTWWLDQKPDSTGCSSKRCGIVTVKPTKLPPQQGQTTPNNLYPYPYPWSFFPVHPLFPGHPGISGNQTYPNYPGVPWGTSPGGISTGCSSRGCGIVTVRPTSRPTTPPTTPQNVYPYPWRPFPVLPEFPDNQTGCGIFAVGTTSRPTTPPTTQPTTPQNLYPYPYPWRPFPVLPELPDNQTGYGIVTVRPTSRPTTPPTTPQNVYPYPWRPFPVLPEFPDDQSNNTNQTYPNYPGVPWGTFPGGIFRPLNSEPNPTTEVPETETPDLVIDSSELEDF